MKNLVIEKRDIYSFEIEYLKGPERLITITFVNGRFQECIFRFNGKYGLEHWRALKEIAERIEGIENSSFADPAR